MRRSKEERLQWEQTIWDLRLKGWTQRAIAEELGVNQSTIHKTLHKLSTRVAQEVSLSIRRRKAVQVAQLEQVAHEAWLGWKRSKQPAITIQKQ